MPTRLPKANSDINVWGISNNNFYYSQAGIGEYINIDTSTNNTITIKQGTRFVVHKTDTSYTISSTVATGNNEYPAGSNIQYLVSEAIFEDIGDRSSFIWGTHWTAGTKHFYLYCSGGSSGGSTAIGQGLYNVSTEIPIYYIERGGYYNSFGKVIASFDFSTATTVISNIKIMQNHLHYSNDNDIINENMSIVQRGTTFTAVTPNQYTLDRWKFMFNTTASLNVSQDFSSPNDAINTSMKILVNTKSTSIAAATYCKLTQSIEGFNFKKYFDFSMTVTFWIYSYTTGIMSVTLSNQNDAITYISNVSINTANQWERKVVNIPIPISSTFAGGPWDKTNYIGANLNFVLAAGANYIGSSNVWGALSDIATNDQTNFLASTQALYITGIKAEPGNIATNHSYNYELDLERSKRYFERINAVGGEYFCSGAIVQAVPTKPAIYTLTYDQKRSSSVTISFSTIVTRFQMSLNMTGTLGRSELSTITSTASNQYNASISTESTSTSGNPTPTVCDGSILSSSGACYIDISSELV